MNQIRTSVLHTHLLVEVNSVAHEGRVVDEVEARPVLWHIAFEKKLLSQLHSHARIKHLGVPQAVDHDDQRLVKLAECLATDMKGLLKKSGIGRRGRVRRNQQ